MSTNVSKIVITVRYELLILVDIPGCWWVVGFFFYFLKICFYTYLLLQIRVFNIIINFLYFLISCLQMRVLNLMNSVRLILSNFFNSNNLSLDPKYQYSLKKKYIHGCLKWQVFIEHWLLFTANLKCF